MHQSVFESLRSFISEEAGIDENRITPNAIITTMKIIRIRYPGQSIVVSICSCHFVEGNNYEAGLVTEGNIFARLN